MIKRRIGKIIFVCLALMICINQSNHAYAKYETATTTPIITPIKPCAVSCVFCACTPIIQANHTNIRTYMSAQFRLHRNWMIDTYFMENVAFAMGQMTNQMTAVAMQQMKILGGFFDAKHQLETQRLFQRLMAEAHKDYQPSEGMCDFGTTTRGLLTADKKTDIVHQVLANRVMDRQLRTGENLTINSNTDLYSRIDMFKNHFCSKKDNGGSLSNICEGAAVPDGGDEHAVGIRNWNINKDVDYTATVETALTIRGNFEGNSGKWDLDERNVFALMANLFAHDIMPSIGSRVLADGNGNPRTSAFKYMDLRAVAAKRSVAQNSISAIVSERVRGDNVTEQAPFLKSVVFELGILPEEVDLVLGKHPSYFSQMELLTKHLYQHPVFYTELYDKPANVLRKRTAIRAIGLIQDRDFYKSLLRSEAVLSVLLESMLDSEHDRVYSHLNRLKPNQEAANQ